MIIGLLKRNTMAPIDVKMGTLAPKIKYICL